MFKSFNYLKIFVLIFSILFLFSCTEEKIVNSCDTLEWNKKIAKNVVHTHAIMISEFIKDIPDTTDRILFIRNAIDSVRFYDDKSGYFYVYNFDCLNIAHATQKDLQGQNLYNHQDAKGKYVIRELSAAAQNGGGYVEFYWLKPGETGEKRKMGYVEPIPNSNYFIGSGVYLE